MDRPTDVTTRFKQPKNPNKKRDKPTKSRAGMSHEHLAKIRKLPSCLSGKGPCDPHHLLIKRERGVGMRATDRWAVPLTRHEHDELHRKVRNETQEEAYFKERGIDCYELANALWNCNLNFESMQKVLVEHYFRFRKPGGTLPPSGMD
jgi:hypothetical protein